MSVDLIATARILAKASPRKPRQSDLKRAVSTAYYAQFHEIARDAANLLVGAGSDQKYGIWHQTYRSLEHGNAKTACGQLRKLGFPDTLCDCGAAFIELQQARHKADYDPYHSVSRVETLSLIGLAEAAIKNLRASERLDRKAFAVLLLFKRRS